MNIFNKINDCRLKTCINGEVIQSAAISKGDARELLILLMDDVPTHRSYERSQLQGVIMAGKDACAKFINDNGLHFMGMRLYVVDLVIPESE